MRGQLFLKEIYDLSSKHARYNYRMLRKPRETVYFGVTIPVQETDELFQMRRQIFSGVYERPELETLDALLRPGDAVVECGAGCGVVSCFIAKRIGPAGRFVTHEANAKLLPSIQAIARANGVNVPVVSAAVGDHDGSMEFYSNDKFLSSSLHRRSDRVTREQTTVNVLSLSKILRSFNADILVMDIEGAETCLLSADLPDKLRAIVIEVHPHIIGDDTVSAIIARLISRGFSLVLGKSDGLSLAFVRMGDASTRS